MLLARIKKSKVNNNVSLEAEVLTLFETSTGTSLIYFINGCVVLEVVSMGRKSHFFLKHYFFNVTNGRFNPFDDSGVNMYRQCKETSQTR